MCFSIQHWNKNGVILTLKVESLAELKFDPGFRVIGEYLSQIDSILRVNLNWLSLSSQLSCRVQKAGRSAEYTHANTLNWETFPKTLGISNWNKRLWHLRVYVFGCPIWQINVMKVTSVFMCTGRYKTVIDRNAKRLGWRRHWVQG